MKNPATATTLQCFVDLEKKKKKRCVSGLSWHYHSQCITHSLRFVNREREDVVLGCILGQTLYPDTRLELFRGWQVKTNDPNVILDSLYSGSIQSGVSPSPIPHPPPSSHLIHFQGNRRRSLWSNPHYWCLQDMYMIYPSFLCESKIW